MQYAFNSFMKHYYHLCALMHQSMFIKAHILWKFKNFLDYVISKMFIILDMISINNREERVLGCKDLPKSDTWSLNPFPNKNLF